MMGPTMFEFMKMSRELLDHAHCSEMATNYHIGFFDYGYYTRLLHKVVLEKGDADEIKALYPSGIEKARD